MPQSIEGGVVIINTLSTKNNGNYPLVMAESVEMKNGKNVEDEITEITENISGIINDADINQSSTWSSESIVSRICPPFELSGSIVTCQPVEGSQLNTIVQIEPVQEGTGDPSPENIRPIRGWDTIKLTHNEQEISIPLGQTVYGGTLDVGRGVLTVDRALRTLSDSENWLLDFDESKSLYWHSIILYGSEIADYLQANKSVSSHLKYGINTENGFWLANLGNNLRIANNISTTEEWKDYLISENSSGHPVQVLYYIATPVTLQLTPQEIRALSGVNTIYTDTGDVTVSGYSDPNAIINSLADRIAALESATTSLIINELDYN